MKSIFIMGKGKKDLVYSKEDIETIKSLTETDEREYTAEDVVSDPTILKGVDFIFSSWGAPCFDEKLLSSADKLKVIFYGAGSIKSIVSDYMWNKGVRITSAYEANAVPVAEFALCEILLSLKRVFYFERETRLRHKFYFDFPYFAGGYKSKVGIISMGSIGKKVAEKLKQSDVEVYAYDPYLSPEQAEKYNVKKVELNEIFSLCDVISVHTPWLKETENMIGKEQLELMKENSTLINTSRGAIINENELISFLEKRADVYALLDVTYPEPPRDDSPLYTLPNVVLTPHIAGSLQNECKRMGNYMLSELKNYLSSGKLKWEITKEKCARMA